MNNSELRAIRAAKLASAEHECSEWERLAKKWRARAERMEQALEEIAGIGDHSRFADPADAANHAVSVACEALERERKGGEQG